SPQAGRADRHLRQWSGNEAQRTGTGARRLSHRRRRQAGGAPRRPRASARSPACRSARRPARHASRKGRRHYRHDQPAVIVELPDLAAMEALGRRIAGQLRPGVVVALSGGLGAGKTTLARAIVGALGYGGEVPSPTFTIVETYDPPAV